MSARSTPDATARTDRGMCPTSRARARARPPPACRSRRARIRTAHRPRRTCPPGTAPRQTRSTARFSRGVQPIRIDVAQGRDGAREIRSRRGAPVTLELNAAEHDTRAIHRRGKPLCLPRRLFGGIELPLVIQAPGIGQGVRRVKRYPRQHQHHNRIAEPSHPGIVTYPTGSPNSLIMCQLIAAALSMML